MTLTEYMTLYHKTDGGIAEKTGYSRTHINRVRRGISRPSWSLVSAIQKATKNKVEPGDWHGQEL